jgi:hypothetical protein
MNRPSQRAMWAAVSKAIDAELHKAIGAHIITHTLDTGHETARFSICPSGLVLL